MIVSDIVAHFGAVTPRQAAVVDRDREVSYAELAARAIRRSDELARRKVRAGDRVAVFATDCAEYVDLVCGLSRLGAAWVPVNHRLTASEVAHILADSGAVGVYHTADRESVVAELRDTCDGVWFARLDATAEPAANVVAGVVDVDPDTVFCVMYTSGTTGRPKGAALTHRQFLAGTYYLRCGIGITGHDRILQCLPQFHAGGAIYQFAYLLAGATVILTPRFDPELVAHLAARHSATSLGLVPTMMHALTESGGMFPGVRRIVYGGSPVDQDVLLRMIERYPVDYVQTYGQTEAGVIVTVLDPDAHRRASVGGDERLLRSCGRPLLGYDVRLGAATADGVGEIEVRSASVMRCYWRHEDATRAVLVDGWLRTGDVGHWDDEGYLYVVDRKSALIITGGENVYPLEVERVLCAHPSIEEAAVVGVPDERWGETVKAYLVASNGDGPPDVHTLREHCRRELAGFKIPKLVEYVPALPRNASGKVTKHRLSVRQ